MVFQGPFCEVVLPSSSSGLGGHCSAFFEPVLMPLMLSFPGKSIIKLAVMLFPVCLHFSLCSFPGPPPSPIWDNGTSRHRPAVCRKTATYVCHSVMETCDCDSIQELSTCSDLVLLGCMHVHRLGTTDMRAPCSFRRASNGAGSASISPYFSWSS